ncbi:hypothetical protein Tco_0558042 [Tanacetum coccineum]
MSISTAPEPSVQDDPSVNRVYSSGSSSSTSIRVTRDSSSSRLTRKSANIIPLTDTLAYYVWWHDQGDLKSRGSIEDFVSFREMIKSKL